MLSAIIFDFDGLIIDTESPELDAWQEVYEAHGQTLAIDVWSDCVGRPPGTFDPIAHLEGLTGAAIDRAAVAGSVRSQARSRAFTQPALPGVEAWLGESSALGIPIGIASSSSHAWVEGHLRRLGIRERFEVVVCREDTIDHKPLPAPYLLAAERLGVDPARVLVVEDAPNGVAAAKAAGMWCLAVPNVVTAPLDFRAADLRIDSLAEMSIADVARRLGTES